MNASDEGAQGRGASGRDWFGGATVAAPARPPLASDLDVEVCVIGGGLAGLAAAHAIARRGGSVVVIEAGRVAAEASRHNAGLVAPGFAMPASTIVERLGLARAKELWALSVTATARIRALIRETGMPVEPVAGALAVQRTNDEAAVRREADLIAGELGTAAELWSTERVRHVLRTPYYFQALHLSDAFHLNPGTYALALAAAAERAGVRIYESTPAVAMDPAGLRKRVDTPQGRIRARHLVLCTGAGLAPLLPQVAGTQVPLTTFAAVTAPLGDALAAIRYPGAVSEQRAGGAIFRLLDRDRLLWCGGLTTQAAPRNAAARLRADIAEIFPQLGRVEIAQAWSGVASYAAHGMPQIGEITSGVWLADTFGRHGLNTTVMAAGLIAGAIIEGDDRWRLFSSYELVRVGGRAGRIAVQALLWGLAAGEGVVAQVSRQRDAAQRRREARDARAAAQAAERRLAAAVAAVEAVVPVGDAPRPSPPRAAAPAQRPAAAPVAPPEPAPASAPAHQAEPADAAPVPPPEIPAADTIVHPVSERIAGIGAETAPLSGDASVPGTAPRRSGEE
jgi:gamma-glutamylputrescine oxidase